MLPGCGELWAHFEDTARRLPDHPALCLENGSLSYGELLLRAAETADRLERFLADRRVIAVYADLAPATVISLLAASRAKTVAILLDRFHPSDFTASVLKETEPAVVLDSSGSVPVIAKSGFDNAPSRGREGVGDLDKVAVVVWTSGSTGRPKGVALLGEGLVRDARTRIRDYRLSPEDRIAWTASPSFAGAVQDVCFTLLSGGALLPWTLNGKSAHDVNQWLAREGASFFRPPVSYYRHWIRSLPASGKLPALRTVSLGGQAVSWDDLLAFRERFPEGRRIVHRYAVTECNLVAQAVLDSGSIEGEKGSVPLGFPAAGKRVLVVGEDGEELKPGEAGQVAVIGDCLSPGYWGRPDLTAERFVELPEGLRMFLTGDLGRIRPDGQLELLGRRDGQLKIRGFRVEPAQVERAIRDIQGVRDAAVVPWAFPGRQGERVLLAYIELAEGKNLPSDSLRRVLAGVLPPFMIPSRFMFLPEMPRNQAGKLDWKSLPDPGTCRPELTGRFVPPEGRVERELAGLWEEVLEISPVGAEDDFFDLGGDSLTAVQLFSRIGDRFGRHFPLGEMLRARTVRSMGRLLQDEGKAGKPASGKCLVPVSVAGGRPRLFLVHGGGGNVLCFARLAARLSGYDVYALQAMGLDRRHLPDLSAGEMATRYEAEIREVQPAGPYRVAGYSFGGLVAFELALRLQASGSEVGFLGLLDRGSPARSTAPPRGNLVSEIWDRGTTRLKFSLRVKVGRILLGAGFPVPFMEKIHNASIAYISRDYRPTGVYRGDVVLFQTEERRGEDKDPASGKGWGNHVSGGIRVFPVPGNHHTLLEDPHVEGVAEAFRRALEGAGEASP